MSRPDDHWIAALQSDAPNQNLVLADLRNLLYRSLARSFGKQFSDSDLDDLTQDSLYRIQKKLDTYAGRSKFTTWATSIAVRLALSELRRRKHSSVSLEQALASGQKSIEPMQTAEAPAQLQRTSRDRLLQEAIDSALTDKQRTALLAELGGLPLEVIAQRTGSSRGAIYKLLHDARKRLLAYFECHGVSASDILSNEETSP